MSLSAHKECIVKKFSGCLIFSLATVSAASAAPAVPTTVATALQAASQVPLKVQVVVSRHLGEKKVSSVPFTLAVIANDGDKTSLRMGVDVPVPQTVFGSANAAVPQVSYTYRSVGTNIDCSARSSDAGVFKLDLAVSDTSVFVTDKDAAANPTRNSGIPAFRSFTSTFNLLLKDGQTAQHTAATDPVSGEVLRIDVTLTVLK